MQQSAGVLFYRRGDEDWEVLLVHPSGNYNRRAPWSIPKGLPEENESLQEAARREAREETGVEAQWLVELGSINYRKSRKRVHCFAAPLPPDADPQPASWEIDQASLFPLDVARQKIHPDQLPFLDRLQDHLQDLQNASRNGADGR